MRIPPLGVGLLVAAGLGAELFLRLPPGLRAPELLLFPLVLGLAYRYGLRTGLGSALAAAAYLPFFLWRLEPATEGIGSAPAWRLALAALVAAAAAGLGTLRDRAERLSAREREARDAAAAAERRTRGILEGFADGLVMLDREGRFTYVNRAAQHLLRRPGEELLGREARAVFPPSLYLDFYRELQRGAASQAPVRFEASAPDDVWIEVHAAPSREGVAMYFRDVTERRRHEEKLRSMTLIDELTGLYNRRGFFALAEKQCKLAARKQRAMILVFADLDDLKGINDTFGHVAGDQALFEAAAVLRHTFRETDVVARIGGDEFAALVLESVPDTAPLLLRRLEANLEQANAEGTLPFDLSLSYGVATFDGASASPIDELLSLADHRMYEHKRAKRRE